MINRRNLSSIDYIAKVRVHLFSKGEECSVDFAGDSELITLSKHAAWISQDFVYVKHINLDI